MHTRLFAAQDRGRKDIGWLQSNFFFSFSDYYEPTRSAFGTLIAFNDDFVQEGKGFGTHPHMNMEIVSIMLQGSMNHKDSMGYSNVVHEDWVQIMSAGSGLYHEEYNVGNSNVNFLQIWIQPKQQNIRPRYQWRNFPKDQRKNILKTVISYEEGMEHCWINQNTKMSLGFFDAGLSTDYRFNPVNKCAFVFVIRGTIEVNGALVGTRDALGLWNTGDLKITCKEESEYLVVETPVNQK